MKFSREDVDKLLVECHRRCCICHRFCGVKMETDHIIPEAEGGMNAITNAIPVCFECHAEIHSYNDKHPRGRKFSADELKQHKEQWLTICKNHPEALINALRNADVGPLQALIDELEFNACVAEYQSFREHGCLFHSEQFSRAIKEGIIAILEEGLKRQILEAYVAIGRANQYILNLMNQAPDTNAAAVSSNRAANAIIAAKQKIEGAKKLLLEFLRSTDA